MLLSSIQSFDRTFIRKKDALGVQSFEDDKGSHERCRQIVWCFDSLMNGLLRKNFSSLLLRI